MEKTGIKTEKAPRVPREAEILMAKLSPGLLDLAIILTHAKAKTWEVDCGEAGRIIWIADNREKGAH